jgi:hypothetical protein
VYFVLSKVLLKMNRDDCDKEVCDGFISLKYSQTSRGYCLCVLPVQHNHEQWEVTVCVCYQSKIQTSRGYCLYGLSVQHNHGQWEITVYVFYQSKIITERGYCVCVLSVHKQWEVTVYVCCQSKIITNIKRLLFMHFVSPT